jgi:AcrR family transcriptional regulator
MVSEKERLVIERAPEVFRRYGYARTTMGDIAAAAGLSRPALYLVFPNKKEIYGAVVKSVSERSLEAIREGLRNEWPLEKKLLYTLEMSIGQAFDRVKAYPNAEDLLSFNFESHKIEPSFANLQSYLAELLREAVASSRLGVTAQEVARTLLSSMRGFKMAATDGPDLRRLIALQVSLTVAALAPSAELGIANQNCDVHICGDL